MEGIALDQAQPQALELLHGQYLERARGADVHFDRIEAKAQRCLTVAVPLASAGFVFTATASELCASLQVSLWGAVATLFGSAILALSAMWTRTYRNALAITPKSKDQVEEWLGMGAKDQLSHLRAMHIRRLEKSAGHNEVQNGRKARFAFLSLVLLALAPLWTLWWILDRGLPLLGGFLPIGG